MKAKDQIIEMTRDKIGVALMQLFVMHAQQLKKPWPQLTKSQQDDVLDAIREGVKENVKTAVEMIAARDRTQVLGRLDAVTIKNGITASIKIGKGIPNLHRLGSRTDEPLHAVSAQGTHHAEVRAFLIKYYGTDQDPELNGPLHTITTKDRFGLVTIQGEQYAIADIGLRMLTPRELFTAQGFPLDYVIEHDGKGKAFTKTAQVARCGNSVCPPLAAALVRANYLVIGKEIAA